jgi:methylated-DNA-[protein]-cysteine S-methyltransferase
MTATTLIDSPVGELTLASDGDALTLLHFGRTAAGTGPEDAVLLRARTELEEFFAGDRRAFDVPVRPLGTPFQEAVWTALLDIPYGETEGYGALAERLGRRGAARAVGLANGRNPVAIMVPCHRVVGASGALTGYGGGLERKRWLLAHEAATARW